MLSITSLKHVKIRAIALSPALIICSILFILPLTAQGETIVAAPGQPVAGRLIVESDGGADIFFEAPRSIDCWTLVPSSSPNVAQMNLLVYASTDWQMAVSCDRPDGRMAEYDLATSRYAAGGRAMANPLQVSSSWEVGPTDPLEVVLPQGGLIRQGGKTPADGMRFQISLAQKVAWTDEPLDGDRAYRIALTFTVSPG